MSRSFLLPHTRFVRPVAILVVLVMLLWVTTLSATVPTLAQDSTKPPAPTEPPPTEKPPAPTEPPPTQPPPTEPPPTESSSSQSQPEPTSTPVPPSPTSTPSPLPTRTSTPTSTPTPTGTPTSTPTSTRTPTPAPTPSATPTPTSAFTPTRTATRTAIPLTHTPTSTPGSKLLSIDVPGLSGIGSQVPPYLLPGLAVLTLIVIPTGLLLVRRWRSSIGDRSLPEERRQPSTSPSPCFPFETIGRHEIRELLGTGGAATIYKAYDPVLRRDVVVKVLHPHLLNTDAALRIQREARALASLRHPTIPRIIEVIQEEPGVLALVEEYAVGEPLDQVLDERGPLPLMEAVTIACIVADALDHAHRNGIVHRDVKPANILVSTSDDDSERPVGYRASLLDFGLAAYYDDSSLQALTSQGDLLGTPAYMSPEQVKGARGDARSDIYSLGVVLYEMLTGERPFQADTPHGTLMLQINEEPPDRPLEGLPKSVRAVVKKALRKSPDLRYQSVRELADALRKAAGIAAGALGDTVMKDVGTAIEDPLAKASPQRDRVIATIHTDQVLVFQGRHAEGPAVTAAGENVGDASPKEAPALQVYALGGGRIVRDGQTCEWRGAVTKELFFYILLHGPLERDAIGVVFWPDLPARKVANNFHYAISQIRRAIGADAVVVEGSKYRIGEDYWFDVEEFETVVERARLLSLHDSQTEGLWQRAVTLYQGDFLPEVERAWCVPKRETLREMVLESLVGVGQCHEARGELEGAIGWYKRVLEIDELREDVHRHVIRCYAEAGRRSDAVAQYQRCREILKQELGLEPSAETERLYRQIATGGR